MSFFAFLKILFSSLLFYLIAGLLVSGSCNQNHVIEKVSASEITKYSGDTVSEIEGEIRCIIQDSKNNMWFASNGFGAYLYDGKTIFRFTDANGLCSNYTWGIQESNDGKIWFKSRDSICYLDDRGFHNIQPDTCVHSFDVKYLNQELIFENFYDGKKLVKIHLPYSSPLRQKNITRFDYDIYSILKDRKGNIWFGTCTAGICRFDGKTFSWMSDSALAAPVRSLFEDRNGVIWIGNNGYGLLKYAENTLVNVTKEAHLDNPDYRKSFSTKEGSLIRIWSMTDDSKGNLWIGTIDTGVWMYDGRNFTNYTTKNGLGVDAIWILCMDKSGNLWAGTEGAGVYKLVSRQFIKFKA